MNLEIEIINRQRKIRISHRKVKVIVKKIFNLLLNLKDKNLLKILKYGNSTLIVSIIFLSSRRMQEINFKYKGKKDSTDVLTFSYLNREGSDKFILGEILVDPKRVLFQSKYHGITFWQELKRVLTHGILHLLNYDHETSIYQAKKMKAIENKILSFLLQTQL